MGKNAFKVKDRAFLEPAHGLVTLCPHPASPRHLAMIIAGTDNLGLENALRVFPIRTGVPLPDWLVLAPNDADHSAGFFSNDWRYSEAMSYLQ